MNVNIHEQIDRRRFGRPMKQALRRVLIGESYRAAAAAEAVDHADLWKAATSVTGFCEEHLRAWRASWGDEFPPEWQHHLNRVEVRRAAAATLNRGHR
jgi:homospermidine synthase